MTRAFSASVQTDQIPGALSQASGHCCAVGAKHMLSLISRFVFCNESVTKLIECPAFNFCARLVHQIQIEVQIVQRDQAKPENFLSLNEMANVAAREFPAGGTRAVFFNGSFVSRELGVF
jgi:hypothetical protein